ncbi:MAG: phosphotransferase [Nanoarchaeota archaeon]|nr:phosphotransferase [Nanoarchaeota archaeon]
MTSLSKVKQLFYKRLMITPVKIVKLTEGMVNEVFEVQTSKADYILRIEPPWFDTVKRASEVMSELYDRKIISNKVLICDTSKRLIKKNYMILEKVQGNSLMKELESNKLTLKEAENILKKAIKTAMKISKIKTQGYGWMKDYPKGWADSEAREVFSNLSNSLLMIKKKKFLPLKIINKINEVFYKNSEVFDYKNPKLVFQDLNFGNIIVKDKKFAGLIDFDGCFSGDPLRAYVILYFVTYKSRYEKLVKKLLKLDKNEWLKLRLLSIEFILRIVENHFKFGNKLRTNYGGQTNKEVILMLLKQVS